MDCDHDLGSDRRREDREVVNEPERVSELWVVLCCGRMEILICACLVDTCQL
jgi:hypothetical protein